MDLNHLNAKNQNGGWPVVILGNFLGRKQHDYIAFYKLKKKKKYVTA